MTLSSHRRRLIAKDKVTVDRSAWVAAARKILIREGADAVRIERVAGALKVCRGGFYKLYNCHRELMHALLEDWQRTNSVAMLSTLRGRGAPRDRLRALLAVWVNQAGYSSKYDLAVRAWRATSKKAAQAVKAVDESRIAALHQVLLDAGYGEMDALVRARIFYFHLVGCDVVGMRARRAEYRASMKLYYSVLSGFHWDHTETPGVAVSSPSSLKISCSGTGDIHHR